MQLSDIVDVRREYWDKYHDDVKDRELCEAAAVKIIETEELRAEIAARPYKLIEALYTIVDKRGKLVPFFLNAVQRDIQEHLNEIWDKGGSIYVLKGRQQGVTSYTSAVQLSIAITQRHWRGMTIADCESNTLDIFKDKGKVLLERMPSVFTPTISEDNANTLAFGKLDNAWRVATATPKVGRSKTLNFLHLSEIAFYSVPLADIQSSVGQSVTPDGITVYETTANGYNEAKRLWDAQGCVNLFYEWWRSEEYADKDTSVIDNVKDGWLLAKIEMLYERGLSVNQIAWYVNKYNKLGRNKIMQEYPCSAAEAFVASGNCYFDLERLVLRLEQCKQPLKCGDFLISEVAPDGKPIKWVWQERKNGSIRIYQEPEDRTPYIAGGDTAGEGSDNFTACMLDNTTGKQVAVLQGRYEEEEYARQVYCLGTYYNNALLSIEVNFSTYPVKKLQEWSYPKQYMRQQEDTISHKFETKFGFKTTTLTRPNALAELQTIVREEIQLINDGATIGEMQTFVKNDSGKYEASSGEHDDLVMATAIAYYSRPQQAFKTKDLPVAKPVKAIDLLKKMNARRLA